MENLNLKVRTVLEMIIVPIIGYGVYLLSDMNKNIQNLNMQVAIILNERETFRETLRDHEQRLRIIETKRGQ